MQDCRSTVARGGASTELPNEADASMGTPRDREGPVGDPVDSRSVERGTVVSPVSRLWVVSICRRGAVSYHLALCSLYSYSYRI